MVFESLIVELLNKYLGDYIENLDKSQLKLSLWGGDVKLENLDIKPNAFDDLDLPIRVLQGHLGLLTLKIPWKHLYTEPWVVELDGLFVLAVPNMALSYNEEKDKKYRQEAKMKELRKIEEAKQQRAESKQPKAEEKDSFGLKLGMQILKNLQVQISNIHIRYEDEFSNPHRPYSAGVTLHRLSLQTTDDQWKPCTIRENVKQFHKLIELECLSLYWNSKPKLYGEMKRGLLKNTMKSHIASTDNPKVPDYKHIIRPISSTGKLIINMRPEMTNFRSPMFWVDLVMNEMKFALSRSQYVDITSTLGSVNRMVTQAKYLKYRPMKQLSKDTLRQWWKFAYNVILEETVRRRRRMWSWENMRRHRALCKQYTEVYMRVLQGKSLYAEEKKTVAEAEEKLDVFNITVCRQRAEMQLKKQEKSKKGGGWFSGWWGGSKAEPAKGAAADSLTAKFEAEMTAEEKMKLYAALDYEEHGVQSIAYPETYVATTVRFQLYKYGFSLFDDDLKYPRILKSAINTLTASVDMRPAGDGIKVSATVDSMVVLGCKQREGEATIVRSLLEDKGPSKQPVDNLLNVAFEQHPLDKKCDSRVHVTAQPLEIVYDAATVNHIAQFFQAPEDVRLDELSSAVMNSLEEVKEITTTGLKHIAQKRLYTDIKVEIKPSYFILPDAGVFYKGCRMLLVDLGSVSILSERPTELNQADVNSGALDFDQIKDRAYDLFNVTLQSMQVLYFDKNDDWQAIRMKSESRNHILRPLGFHVLLKKCIIDNDVRLPSIIVTGELPLLALDVSDYVLKNVIELLIHVPWPESKKSDEMVEEEKRILTVLKTEGAARDLSTGQILRAVAMESTSTSQGSDDEDEFEDEDSNSDALEEQSPDEQKKQHRVKRASKQLVNLVKVDVLFIVRTVELRVHERNLTTNSELCVLCLRAESIGTSMTQRKFDLEVQAYIGSVELQHMQIKNDDTGEYVGIVKTRKHREAEKLLYVKVLLAERRAPNFFEHYQGIRKKITGEFKTLEMSLHQEAILSLIEISNRMLLSLTPPETEETARPKEVWEEPEEVPEWDRGRSLVGKTSPGEQAQKEQIDHMKSRRKEKISDRISGHKTASEKVVVSGQEVRELVVEAVLESFLLRSCSKRHNIAEVAIKGLGVELQMDSRATQLAVTLNDISVKDLAADSLYRTVVWIDEKVNLFSMQLVVFNDNTTKPWNQLNLEKIDVSINLTVGELNFIFLYSFVSRLLAYFKNFQSLLNQAKEQAQHLSEKAVEKVKDKIAVEIQPRVAIEMDVSAPVIYLPQNSRSPNALMLDLGRLSFSNRFELDTSKGTRKEETAVLEISMTRLENLKICRAYLGVTDRSPDPATVDVAKNLLLPITVEMSIVRNLSAAYYFDKPGVELDAKMNTICLAMTQGDYQVMMRFLGENMREDRSDTISAEAQSVAKTDDVMRSSGDEAKVAKDSGPTEQNSPDIAVKFNFIMQSVQLELIKGDPIMSQWNNEQLRLESQFARFIVAELKVSGDMKREGDLALHASVSDCKLQDTRPGITNRITKMLESRGGDQPMLDVVFEQAANKNMKIRLEMCRFYMCACTDYLMSIAEFFVKSSEGPDLTKEQSKLEPSDEVANKKAIAGTPKKKPPPARKEPEFEIDFQGVIHEPEIILVENSDSIDTNVIILKLRMNARYWLTHDRELIEATIQDMQVLFCPYIVEERANKTLQIMAPFSIGFNANTPTLTGGMHGDLSVSNIVIMITPVVIQSISRISATLSQASEAESFSGNSSATLVEEDFWLPKPYCSSSFPFLGEMDPDSDVVETATDVIEILDGMEVKRDDVIFFKVDHVAVILEMDVKNKSVPMLVAEVRLDGEINNWSRDMTLIFSPSLVMSYYNNRLNLWEPLIEPLEQGMNFFKPWECTVEMKTNNDAAVFCEELEDTAVVQMAPSKMILNVSATDPLEITLSKVALDVLQKLGDAFTQAYKQKEATAQRDICSSPVIVVNKAGLDLALMLDQTYEWPGGNSVVSIPSGDTVQLELAKSAEDASSRASRSICDAERTLKMVVAINKTEPSTKREITIRRTEIRAFDINKKSYPGVKWQLMADITVYMGIRTISLHSVLQMENQTPVDIEVQYYNEQSRLVPLTVLAAGALFYVPMEAVYSVKGDFAFRPAGGDYSVSSTSASWRPKKEEEVQRLSCLHDNGSQFYLNVNLRKTPIFYDHTEEKRSFLYTLAVAPPMQLHNQLPHPLDFFVSRGEKKPITVQPGSLQSVFLAGSTQDSIVITFDYMEKEWHGKLCPGEIEEELTVIVFESKNGYEKVSLDLGVRQATMNGCRHLTLYSPYWMINKTGLPLTYRTSDDDVCCHPASMDGPVLFSFRARSIFGKKKDAVDTELNQARAKMVTTDSDDELSGAQAAPPPASASASASASTSQKGAKAKRARFRGKLKTYLRVSESQWSDRFSLDTVGNWGRVTCKTGSSSYDVGVRISLSSSGLTKIVTFMPYFMIVNNTPLALSCKEVNDSAEWVPVTPGEAMPFWPMVVGKTMLMQCQVTEEKLVTQPFPFNDSHSVLMKLDKQYGGIFVEVQCSEEATVITLEQYVVGMAPVVIINTLESEPVYYQQNGSAGMQKLMPGQMVHFAWENVVNKRELLWTCGSKNKVINNLSSDGLGDFKIASQDRSKVFWVSFIHDMQRILLFTQEAEVAKRARYAHDLEQFDQEFTFSIQSIGLSLVGHERRQEISYVSISKSGVKWHEQRKTRLRPLKMNMSDQIEAAYQDTQRQAELDPSTAVAVRKIASNLEVDFSQKPVKMHKPNKVDLYRFSEPGLYMQYKASEHTMSLHVRVYRVQIDSQMMGSVFPVVFAPYPQPKSMAGDAGPKPIAEMSVIIDRASRSKALHVKYMRALIQEMELKLDHGFLNGMLDLFESSVSEKNELDAFQTDVQMIKERLVEIKMINEIVQSGRKNVYDDLHISPIKMHVSFSLQSSHKDDKKTALKSDVLNLFLQSIGVTLTGVQDVIFKLGYFEKNNCMITQKQLMSEITRHYVNQGVKQMYVLVLGLDVIGNPFGVIRGIAKGVEDLFYEPVQGAIQGPEEFAEGVALGVRSLLGHAVGGAAGAVSRITGTLGKGIAALSLDDDYQRRRREQFAKRPDSVQAGLAQGGKGLVMGVFQGVTGIVTKPMEGAKKEGVEGFFKGVGKGLVGVVVRPVSGVVDFASTSFEGIRKVTDTSQETHPMRPPRYIGKDGVLKPYARVEAEGISLLRQVEQGRLVDTERYVAHAPNKNGKQVLIFTDKEAILLERNDLLGSWSLEWRFAYTDLLELPKLTQKGVVLNTKEKQKKLFGSANVCKLVEIDYKVAEWLINVLHNFMDSEENSSNCSESEPPPQKTTWRAKLRK